MVDVKDLTFSYGQHQVLDRISFSLGKGELIAVLGPNGAGKSTLFRCLLGLLRPQGGKILLEGKNILELGRRQIASLAAYVPQAETPVFNYIVQDVALMGATGTLSPFEAPGDEHRRTAMEMLLLLGIEGLAERGIQEISGGERQLALLARALAQKSKILVMDEPTANLDYGNQQLVMRQVKSLSDRGYTILMSTHNPEQALQYATRVLVIKDHRLFAFGTTEEVLTEEVIAKIYGIEVVIAETVVNGKAVKSCIPVP